MSLADLTQDVAEAFTAVVTLALQVTLLVESRSRRRRPPEPPERPAASRRE
jgi:hypothetical protein